MLVHTHKPSNGVMETVGFVGLTDYPGCLRGEFSAGKRCSLVKVRTALENFIQGCPLTFIHPPRETCTVPCYTQHRNEMS